MFYEEEEEEEEEEEGERWRKGGKGLVWLVLFI